MLLFFLTSLQIVRERSIVGDPICKTCVVDLLGDIKSTLLTRSLCKKSTVCRPFTVSTANLKSEKLRSPIGVNLKKLILKWTWESHKPTK